MSTRRPTASPIGISAPAAPARRTGAEQTYWRASRSHRYSILFVLPLLVAYEAMVAALARDPALSVRNGADVILQWLFHLLLGRAGPLVLGALLAGVGIWLVARDMRRQGRSLRPRVFALMLVESACLALAFGSIVAIATAALLGRLVPFALPLAAAQTSTAIEALDLPTKIMLSLGAGIYEELVFRVLLVGALYVLVRRFLWWGPISSGVAAAVMGAVIFSAFHYIGPFGDPLETWSFTFRAVAGLFFSGLFLLRGFGITAWTHALYDLFLLLGHG